MSDILNKEDISSEELSDLLSLRENKEVDFLLIDIREEFEVDDGYIQGCDLFYPTSNFMDFLPELEKNKDKNIVLYCKSGGRSTQSKNFLKQEGFSKISHLDGGITGYSGSLVD